MPEQFPFAMPSTPEIILDTEEKKGYTEFIKDHIRDLELNAAESRGFLHIPAENIRIIPGQNGFGSMMEITEPEVKRGIEKFGDRDAFEKQYPQNTAAPLAAHENAVFRGEISTDAFHPELDARVCFYTVKIYETRDGQYLSMPILPETGQRYQAQSKLPGSQIILGNQKFPNASTLLSVSSKKETPFFPDPAQERERNRLLTQDASVKTGLWTIRIRDKKGKFSDIRDCHIARDPATGTFDIFLIKKQAVFSDMQDFSTTENLPEDVDRIHALIPLDTIKETPENGSMELSKILSKDGQEIQARNIPETYRNILEVEDGKILLKSFVPAPPLRAFLDHERRMINAGTPETLQKAIREKIGYLFEDLVERVIGVKHNEQDISFVAPSEASLPNIPAELPAEFYEWLKTVQGKTLTVKPDFILPDGTFLETKAGGNLYAKPEKRVQLFRMMLYKLMRGEALSSIRFLTLEHPAVSDIPVPEIRSESLFDSEWKDAALQDGNLKSIRQWQRHLL